MTLLYRSLLCAPSASLCLHFVNAGIAPASLPAFLLFGQTSPCRQLTHSSSSHDCLYPDSSNFPSSRSAASSRPLIHLNPQLSHLTSNSLRVQRRKECVTPGVVVEVGPELSVIQTAWRELLY